MLDDLKFIKEKLPDSEYKALNTFRRNLINRPISYLVNLSDFFNKTLSDETKEQNEACLSALISLINLKEKKSCAGKDCKTKYEVNDSKKLRIWLEKLVKKPNYIGLAYDQAENDVKQQEILYIWFESISLLFDLLKHEKIHKYDPDALLFGEKITSQERQYRSDAKKRLDFVKGECFCNCEDKKGMFR